LRSAPLLECDHTVHTTAITIPTVVLCTPLIASMFVYWLYISCLIPPMLGSSKNRKPFVQASVSLNNLYPIDLLSSARSFMNTDIITTIQHYTLQGSPNTLRPMNNSSAVYLSTRFTRLIRPKYVEACGVQLDVMRYCEQGLPRNKQGNPGTESNMFSSQIHRAPYQNIRRLFTSYFKADKKQQWLM
jgi:hypothetical protein